MSVEEKLAQQLELIVLNKISSDRLQLPAMPAMAAKCLDVVRRSDFATAEATSVIEKDPVLAAQVLKVANSAAFATKQPAETVGTCVVRLGASKLKTIIFEVATRQMFESKNPEIAAVCQSMWEHSLAVATLSRDVAIMVGGGEPESAYLAGLLHDVGKPIVATMLLDAESAMAGRTSRRWIERDTWLNVVQRTHRRVGGALSKKWQMPELVTKAVAECDDFDPNQRVSIGNGVRFVNALCKRAGIYEGSVDPEETDALIMVGRSMIGLSDENFERLEQQLREKRFAA